MAAYLIGVDADGTVFDTMTAKHKGAFIPAAFEIWGVELESFRAEFAAIEAHINLYSSTRGIDRFNGLYLAFKRLDEALRPRGLPQYEALRAFLDAGPPYSAATLETFLRRAGTPFLRQTLAWSKRCDELFETLAADVPPFAGVRPALEAMRQNADIAVISSAAGKGLTLDFERYGLMPFIRAIYGQEHGSKAEQLEAVGAVDHYGAGRVLMVGDAEGDRKAAVANGACFFPITPGAEEESWRELLTTGLGRFFGGTFDGEYEDGLYARFAASMPNEARTDYKKICGR